MVNVAVERLVALHRDGLSLAEIARRTRCSRSTVRRRLREAFRGAGINDVQSLTGSGPAAHGSEPT